MVGQKVHGGRGNCPMRSSLKEGLAVFHSLLQECGSDTSVGGILKSGSDSFCVSLVEGTPAYKTDVRLAVLAAS